MWVSSGPMSKPQRREERNRAVGLRGAREFESERVRQRDRQRGKVAYRGEKRGRAKGGRAGLDLCPLALPLVTSRHHHAAVK